MITEEHVMATLAHSNPVPDVEDIDLVQVGTASYLATLEQRSSDMTQSDTNQKESKNPRRPIVPWLIAAGVAAVIGVAIIIAAQNTEEAPVADQPTPTAGPVTIKTEVDLSESPLQGTFEVTVGADLLGCSSGTLVQMNSETFGKKDNVMTCESGSNTGTFTIIYDPGDTSRWSVLESSDDFAGLQGEGRLSWILPSPSTVVETFTGDIEYSS
ncbi:MAG: hypothetical protein V3S26_09175 [Acidimicrobiia bacterium]